MFKYLTQKRDRNAADPDPYVQYAGGFASAAEVSEFVRESRVSNVELRETDIANVLHTYVQAASRARKRRALRPGYVACADGRRAAHSLFLSGVVEVRSYPIVLGTMPAPLAPRHAPLPALPGDAAGAGSAPAQPTHGTTLYRAKLSRFTLSGEILVPCSMCPVRGTHAGVLSAARRLIRCPGTGAIGGRRLPRSAPSMRSTRPHPART